MSKYKIGDRFKTGDRPDVCAFAEAEVIAFTPEGDAILRVASPPFDEDDLITRTDSILDAYYELVQPKPTFFEKGKFYRRENADKNYRAGWPLSYIRYEIKEIFETPQPDGSTLLQAHAEAVSTVVAAQTFLSENDFDTMIKM